MDKHFEYRTGRTAPAESSRGLIAALLVCVIVLGGLVSVLGMLNIHLFRQLSETQSAPVTFAAGADTEAQEDCLLLAGMALQETDPVYQQLHDLPEGLYVAQIEPGSQAASLEIHPGDVLTYLDETQVSTLEAAQALLNAKKSHKLRLWRDGREITLTLSQ